MADHIATAQRYRARAAKCELSAKATSSEKFGECYRLLAQHYLVLANLEEDCANRVSPFARQENKQDPKEHKQDPKQEHKQAHRQDGKLGNRPANEERNNKSAEQAPVRSVAARLFAVRQLQMATPSTETVSMPPMVAIPAAEFGR
jgi:hypothetical protein